MLKSDKLHAIYMDYGQAYRSTFAKISQDVLTDCTTRFTAFEFFSSRGNISHFMEAQLKAKLTPLGITVDALQLKDVDLPAEFENAIVDTQSSQQEKAKAENEQTSEAVGASTLVMEAKFKSEVAMTLANAKARALMETNQAKVDAFKMQQLQRLEGFAGMSELFRLPNGDINATALLDYIKTRTVQDHNQSKLLLAVNGEL
jgi:regulator of protease activity HflC (stomatin/prohibitin superfamily)